MPPGQAIASSTDYRRTARRFRKVYADQPARLYHQLGKLSRAYDSQHAETPKTMRVTAAERFARAVEENLADGLLRYSQRTSLVDSAWQYGLSRFQANLIVARVQHRATVNGARYLRPIRSTRLIEFAIPALAAAAIQLTIVCVTWRLFHA